MATIDLPCKKEPKKSLMSQFLKINRKVCFLPVGSVAHVSEEMQVGSVRN